MGTFPFLQDHTWVSRSRHYGCHALEYSLPVFADTPPSRVGKQGADQLGLRHFTLRHKMLMWSIGSPKTGIQM